MRQVLHNLANDEDNLAVQIIIVWYLPRQVLFDNIMKIRKMKEDNKEEGGEFFIGNFNLAHARYRVSFINTWYFYFICICTIH